MELFDKVKGAVSNTTDSFKMNNQIKENEKKIQNVLYQIGVQCFNSHGEEEGSEYDTLFAQVKHLQNENRKLQADIQALTAGKVCQKCGYENGQDAKFCVGCGAPLDMVVPQAQAQPSGTCPECGAPLNAGALFCTSCGHKL